MKDHFLFIIVLSCVANIVFAQQFDYKPLPVFPEDSCQSLISEIEKKFEKDILTLSEKKHKKELTEIYTERKERVISSLEEEYYVFDEEIYKYVQEIFQEIARNNPEVHPEEMNILVYRSESPNATCLGDGTIRINLGLVRRLENKSQLAFVISHEIAHYVLNHVNNHVEKRINILHSKETQKELKKIKRQKYNSNARLSKLMKDYVYDDSKHSRIHESEADELAYKILRNTSYNPNESIGLLAILDSIDLNKYPYPDIEEHFDRGQYPFKESWNYKEVSFFDLGEGSIDSFLEEDSLKTHPDCKKRIDLMKAQGATVSTKKTDSVYLKLATLADFQVVNDLYQSKQIGKSLFYALQLVEVYPNNPFLHAHIGKCLHKLYLGRKKHKYGSLVDLPSPRMNDNYKKFIDLLQNITMSDYKNMTYYYLDKYELVYKDNEDFLYAWIRANEIMEKESCEKLKSTYKTKFPEGKYIKTLKL